MKDRDNWNLFCWIFGHKFVVWSVTKAPTATEVGWKERLHKKYCDRCGSRNPHYNT